MRTPGAMAVGRMESWMAVGRMESWIEPQPDQSHDPEGQGGVGYTDRVDCSWQACSPRLKGRWFQPKVKV